jgi:hypothetical protein
MPEVATVTRVVQVGVESTPGTSVAANKRLRSITLEPGIQTELNPLRATGGKFPIAAALGKEWIEADIGGYLTYTEIVYLLSSVLVSATPTQISPPTGTAYRWTFTPSHTSEDSIKTFTVENGSSVRAMKWTYGLVSELGITFNRESIELGGTLLGQNLQDGITLTASPTLVDVVPVVPSQVSVYLDTTASGIGTTQLLRVLTAEFSISDRFSPVWTIDANKQSFAAHVETQLSATLDLTLEADAQGMALLSAMRNGDKRFIRIKAVGPNIETGNDYTFQLDLCGLVTGVDNFSDEDGVYAIKWTFSATHDSTFGKALEVQVVNKLSTL